MTNFLEALMIAGICVMVGGCAFLLATGLRAARRAGDGDFRLIDDRPGGRLDLYMGLVWSGMLLVLGSNVLLHTGPGRSYNLSALTLAAAAGNILVCGVFAGRLLLRHEMRRCEERREEQKA
jgi:hypothetical protein